MTGNPNEKIPFSTTIRKSVYEKFRDTCKETNIPMNIIIESFMEQFSEGYFKIGLYRINDK